MPKVRLIETGAERRARLAANEPGEMVFTSQSDYVEAMGAQIRRSKLKMATIAKQSDTIKSGQTVSKLAYGWTDSQGHHHASTQYPRFSTMFGIAAALGVEVVLRPRSARK